MIRLSPLAIVVLVFALCGCGGTPSAKVTGSVTCGDKPVKGIILISPFGDGPDNTGEAVSVPLRDDGSFEIQLKTIGKHRIVVSPSDIVYPAKPGEEYPCDLTPLEKEVKSGDNEFVIKLTHRGKGAGK